MEHTNAAPARALNLAPTNDEGVSARNADPLKTTPEQTGQIVATASFCGNQDDAERKIFESQRAAAAFRGYCLARSNPADGPVTFYATRWGLVRELRDLAAVAAFLRQIGGAV